MDTMMAPYHYPPPPCPKCGLPDEVEAVAVYPGGILWHCDFCDTQPQLTSFLRRSWVGSDRPGGQVLDPGPTQEVHRPTGQGGASGLRPSAAGRALSPSEGV